MLRHPPSISVAFCCIRGKAGCYFLVFTTPRQYCLILTAGNAPKTHGVVLKQRVPENLIHLPPSQCDRVAWRENRECWCPPDLFCWYKFGNYCTGNNFKLPHILSSSVCWFRDFSFVFFSPMCLLAKSEQINGNTEKWSLMHSVKTRERRGSNCMDKFEMPGRAQSSQWKWVSNDTESKENAVHCPSE